MARQRIQPIIINLNFFSKLIDLLGELANIDVNRNPEGSQGVFRSLTFV